MKKFLSMLAITAALLGCSVNPSEMPKNYAKDAANKMVYARDNRTGLCFGFVASRKTGTFSSSGLGATLVPCEKVENYLED